MSNELSLRDGWTRAHAELTSHAKEMGWPGSEGEKVDFAQAYIDPAKPRQVSHIRRMRTASLRWRQRLTGRKASSRPTFWKSPTIMKS